MLKSYHSYYEQANELCNVNQKEMQHLYATQAMELLRIKDELKAANERIGFFKSIIDNL